MSPHGTPVHAYHLHPDAVHSALLYSQAFQTCEQGACCGRGHGQFNLRNHCAAGSPADWSGKVADYIPALASVDGSKLGIAICTVDGQHYQAGDAQERFSIQSISKVLSLVVAMRHYQEDEIWQRVGKDPSGHPFNSLVQLEMEQGIPRNPFINAGALVVCDMLQGV